MYRVAILGCENSHANFFLKYILEDKSVNDVEVVGIYSDEPEAARKLQDQYKVPVAQSYDAFVGKVDGLIITARHGDNHYKYAKPYLESGIPMFIDKPITIDQEEAVEFMRQCKSRGIRISGGSMCKYAALVQELKAKAAGGEAGAVIGGLLRAPISMENVYGGFYFYSQHLVQVMCEIFGCYPQSVRTYQNGSVYTCVFRYADFDVTGVYTDGNYLYGAVLSTGKGLFGGAYNLNGCDQREFDAFYHILKGGAQEMSYRDFVAPVFILNAIHRSLETGAEARINWEKLDAL